LNDSVVTANLRSVASRSRRGASGASRARVPRGCGPRRSRHNFPHRMGGL